MDNRNKEILRHCRVQLSEDLSVEELWNPLVGVGLFTPNELQRIRNRPNSGVEDPMTRLLDALEQKGPLALNQFKKALEDVNKPHLLDIINQSCNGEKVRTVSVDERDISLLLNKEKNLRDKTKQLKDLVKDVSKLQPDGHFKINKENMDLIIQKLDNLNQSTEDNTVLCGACICDKNELCCTSKHLQAENKDLRRQLDKLKTESRNIMEKIQKSLSDIQKSSENEEDEQIKSDDLKMGICKLALDIEHDKESFA